ncbi:hypothetical protein [Micromonospora sp. NPDC003241]
MASTNRRFLILVTVTVVVAVVAGLSVWVAGRASNTGGIATSVPVRFDPSQQLLRFGYLPGPVDSASYTTGPEVHRLALRGSFDAASTPEKDDTSSGGSDWHIDILMAARGADVHRFVPDDEDSGKPPVPDDPIAPVHGRPAFEGISDSNRVLAWEYAPDAWIRMTLSTVSFDYRRDELARQVAEGVRLDTTPRALPFRVKGLPDGALLERAHLSWDADQPIWFAADYLVGQVEQIDENHRERRPVVTVGISTESLLRTRHNDEVTVAGRPATASESRGSGTVGVYRVAQLPGGCAECVAYLHIARSATAAVGERDDALKLAASIRLVKGREDPAEWRFW